ncbi:TonB-dependent receptor plug domain-containing protein [Rikenella microfusus]|uniref:Colicin I receptor n=2 Tax=Rikenella microfusus TaxID=28139 RepID=A0A379MSR1_9BACT|nr:TonB-dependent receptor [Rikenella microfusus]SUE34466.1 Colicin I receptor precursor [Rikenella microfusus]HJE89307.1 TonB-dependent receptor [Rikenella microfusus]
MLYKSLLMAGSLALLGCLTLSAKEKGKAPDEDDPVWKLQSEDVVVTATRTPKLLKDVPVITRVIRSDEIKKTDATTVKDLLEMVMPGIEFTSHGGTMNINLSGMGANYVLFLIDGERIAGEARDNIDYDRLNVENIERIEVVKGAASALYGSNAIGGVVNIITKKATEPWQLNVNARYGRENEQRYGGALGFNTKRFNSFTTGTYKHRNGYSLTNTGESHIEYPDGEQVSNDDQGSTTAIYGYSDWDINQKFVIKPVDPLTITAAGTYYNHEQYSSTKVHDLYRGYTGRLNLNYAINDRQNIEGSYKFDEYDKFDYYLKLDEKDKNYANIQHTGRIQYNNTFRGAGTLTVGAEFFGDKLNTYQFKGDKPEHSTETYVGFAQHDVNLIPKLNLVYGARLDYHSTYGAHVSPKVSLMYKLNPVTLRLSYGGGFKSPTLKELYTDWSHQGMFQLVGNPDLVPEKSQNVSLSAEYTKGKFSASVIGYYNNIRDKISNIWNNDGDTSYYTNIGRAEVWGIDANVSVKLPYGFGITASYAYVHDYQPVDGVNASTARPHSATIRFEYGLKRRNYGLDVNLTGRVLSAVTTHTFDDEYTNPDGTTGSVYKQRYPAYTMWKLVVTQRFRNAVSLNLGADNLFNYKADVHSFNTSVSPGITFFAGVSLDVEQLFRKRN